MIKKNYLETNKCKQIEAPERQHKENAQFKPLIIKLMAKRRHRVKTWKHNDALMPK